jgi:hypothetical protein
MICRFRQQYKPKQNRVMKKNIEVTYSEGRWVPVWMAILVTTVIVGGFFIWNMTAYRDVELLKKEAPEYMEERGFCITSYDGFEGSMYHGGFVWYQVRDSSNHLYKLCIGEWRGEIMIYNQTCLNAVQNSKF